MWPVFPCRDGVLIHSKMHGWQPVKWGEFHLESGSFYAGMEQLIGQASVGLPHRKKDKNIEKRREIAYNDKGVRLSGDKGVRLSGNVVFCMPDAAQNDHEKVVSLGEKLTKGDVEKIQKEIDYRTAELRPQEIQAVQEARAQGDLSENFEYYAAKRDLRRNNSRINYLTRMLKNATIVSDESADGVVGINKIVEVYFEDDDETEKFKLVTSVRTDSMAGKISIESPMGRAINHHKAGDRVLVKIDERTSYYVQIRSVEQGDDSEDTIRPY